jgi:DNA-binding response OmpR family regulator
MRLLVVDDSPTIRKLIEITLRGTSWRLDFAANGAEAVAKAQSGPSAILLDYILPDMKAYDVCRRLAADATTARVPVLLVSSKASLIRDELSVFPQVAGFLSKPFAGAELLAAIAAATEGRTPAGPPSSANTPLPTSTRQPDPPRAPFSYKDKEAVARALYARLRPGLERLPAWARERGDAPAAPYFARKLLTPDVVEGLLEELTAPRESDLPAPTRDARPPVSPALQRELEQLRRPSTWGEAEARALDAERVYERAPGFSAKVRQVELSASEQRILTVIDGRAPLRTVAERTGLDPREVGRVLHRLAQIALVQPRPGLQPSSVITTRTVALLDRDRQGVLEPLAALLRRRPEPIEVHDLAAEPDPMAAIRRDRPCLVLLNPEGAPFDIAELAREVRRQETLANISLAALLERRAPASIDALAAVGFDAVWVKPLHFRDVSQLIASAFLAAELVNGGARIGPQAASLPESHRGGTRDPVRVPQ